MDEDRKGARDMMESLVKDPSNENASHLISLQRNLAYITCAEFFVFAAALFFVSVPISTQGLLFTMFGVLVGKFSSIIDFFYGSSAPSNK